MKTPRLTIIFLTTILLSHCMTLLPREERRIEKLHSSKLSKNQIYSRALVSLSKSPGNAQMNVHLKEEKTGRIVSKGVIKVYGILSCNHGCDLAFDIDFTAKDKKYRILFEDIIMWSYNRYGLREGIVSPTQKSSVPRLYSEYLQYVETDLVDVIEGRSSSGDF